MYVLVVVLLTGTHDGALGFSAEFVNKNVCEAARDDIIEFLAKRGQLFANCYQKGGLHLEK